MTDVFVSQILHIFTNVFACTGIHPLLWIKKYFKSNFSKGVGKQWQGNTLLSDPKNDEWTPRNSNMLQGDHCSMGAFALKFWGAPWNSWNSWRCQTSKHAVLQALEYTTNRYFKFIASPSTWELHLIAYMHACVYTYSYVYTNIRSFAPKYIKGRKQKANV